MKAPPRQCLLLSVFIAVIAACVLACGGDASDSYQGSQPPQMAPTEKQQITVQLQQPESFDPQRSSFAQDIAIEHMLFRGLYQLVPGDAGAVKAVPAMAEGEPEVQGAVYTVRLKAGLKWSDGTPLTAKDFEYSLRRLCDPDTAAPYQYLLGASILNLVGCDDYFAALDASAEERAALRDKVGVQAIDDRTLEVSLAAPKSTFTTIMSLWPMSPIPQGAVEKHGDRWAEPPNMVVNGPFLMTDYLASDHAALAPNPYWALDPKPALQSVSVRFVDDQDVAFKAFQTGELDVTTAPANELPVIEGDAALKQALVKVAAGRVRALGMRMDDSVLRNYDVRLALSRAIDRETLVKVIYGDAYVATLQWLPQEMTAFATDANVRDTIGYSPEKAKLAMADAGYPEGKGFPGLEIIVADNPVQKSEAEFLQAAWHETLGIDVTIRTLDGKTAAQLIQSGEYQLMLSGWQLDYPDPENALVGLFDSEGGNNVYGCTDQQIDAALNTAAAETDEAKRIAALQDAQKLVLTSLCGVTPIYEATALYLVAPKVGGVEARGLIDAALPGGWCPECWFVKD
jgi:oligopeptide transport system substrate-binding protein